MTATSKILVIGATGNIGRHLVPGLRERGADVRALSRHPFGADTVRGDLTEPESLHRALSGVDGVFLLWPFLSADGAQEVVDVIAGHASRVVYVSALNVTDGGPPEQNGVWGQVEDVIRASSLEWTFLRPGGFATNTLQWADTIRAGETVRIPYARAGRSLIDERDIADVAVRVLTEDGHTGKAYPLTGPEVLTQAEQVQVIADVVGRPARVADIPADEARASLLTWSDEAYVDTALAYWATLVDTPEPVLTTVEELTGRPARTFAEWARAHADDFRRLTAAEVGDRYVSAFRAGRLDLATKWTAPDMVRVAPLENGGKHVELRGEAEIMANAGHLTQDVEIHAVEVDGPYLQGDRFAVRFTFDQTHKPTGQRATTAKMSLYTVTGGLITREEVFYFDPPAEV
jgi:uncharacterized protein YbjT (DUF2867 family)